MQTTRSRRGLENTRPMDEYCGSDARSAICDEKPCEEPRAIEARLSTLGTLLKSLENTVEKLRRRLGSALCGPGTKGEANGIDSEPMPVCSPVAESLTILGTRVRLIENEISDLLDRLEI